MTAADAPASLDLRPLVGFGLLAIIDALLVAIAELPELRASTLGFTLAITLLHGLVPGALASFASAWLRGRAASVAITGAAVALGAWVLAEDLSNLVARSGGGAWLASVAGAGAALSVPCAGGVGGRVRRGLQSSGAIATALVLQLFNHALLARSYQGAHLFVTLALGTFVARALPSAPHPRTAPRQLALLLLTMAAFVPAPAHVLTIALRHSGVAVTPFLARAGQAFRRRTSKGAPSFPAQAPSEPPLALDRPLVVLITVDAFRADVLDGHPEVVPVLTSLRSEAANFPLARSPGSSTVVTLSAVFSGKLYSQQRWAVHPEVSALFPHEDESLRWPALLRERGVATIGIDGTLWMGERFGVAVGFADLVHVPRDVRDEYASAPRVVDALLGALETHAGGPSFAFAHLLEPHAPYDRAQTTGAAFDRYLGEIAIADAEIGRLVEGLRAKGLWDRTVLIVSADHGEAFGEHGTSFHGLTVYEELIRVPLIIRVPGLAPQVVRQPVTLLDLGPTVLDLFGLPTPPGYVGQSLLPAMRGEDLPPRVLRIESGRRLQAAISPDGFKVIVDRRTGASELFDLAADPLEDRNLYDQLDQTRPHLDDALEWFDGVRYEAPGYQTPFRPL